MLKKDIQPRPAYLKWAYIGMMTIGFVDGGGFPLPWFTKYVMQVGVLGMALLTQWLRRSPPALHAGST